MSGLLKLHQAAVEEFRWQNWANPSYKCEDAFKAEVTSMEQELAALKTDIERYVKIASDQELKLTALEAQKPVAFGWRCSDGMITDCISPETNAKYPGDYTIPLYLAAGAKEPKP